LGLVFPVHVAHGTAHSAPGGALGLLMIAQTFGCGVGMAVLGFSEAVKMCPDG